MDYFYDNQIRRLILQVTRMFSGFVVAQGTNADGTTKFRQVPVRYGETNRMVEFIIRQNSENKVLYTPFMAVYITNITMAPERRQYPGHIRTSNVTEREFNNETKMYGNGDGDRFTVKKYMGVPYNFNFKLDIWTSNIDQKVQLMEQIMMLFNPSVDFQTSDSPLDWTAITYAEMQDSIQWTGRSVPRGTDDTMDISSFEFKIPGWINPPALVKKQQKIETVITTIRAVDELPMDDSDFAWEQGEDLSRDFFTPDRTALKINGSTGMITLCGGADEVVGQPKDWEREISQFGTLVLGTTKVNVKRKFGDPQGIDLTIVSLGPDDNQATLQVMPESLPDLTMADVDAVVDPTVNYPGNGKLPVAQTGQRYLVLSDMTGELIGENAQAWGIDIQAQAGDIIEYNGTTWEVDFDSDTSTSDQIIKNALTDQYYIFKADEKNWHPLIDGEYMPGTWKIVF